MSAELDQTLNEPTAVPREFIAREVARRRTFGIISHPDAGKTTLTEKLLLFSGAIQLACMVKGAQEQRHARQIGWTSRSSAALGSKFGDAVRSLFPVRI